MLLLLVEQAFALDTEGVENIQFNFTHELLVDFALQFFTKHCEAKVLNDIMML